MDILQCNFEVNHYGNAMELRLQSNRKWNANNTLVVKLINNY